MPHSSIFSFRILTIPSIYSTVRISKAPIQLIIPANCNLNKQIIDSKLLKEEKHLEKPNDHYLHNDFASICVASNNILNISKQPCAVCLFFKRPTASEHQQQQQKEKEHTHSFKRLEFLPQESRVHDLKSLPFYFHFGH